VTVIHNGTDRQRFVSAGRERSAARLALGVGSDVVIGAVGFFREWHGIDLVLKALHRDIAIKRNSRVVLVGDGPVLPSLREMARALELQNHVMFLGSVPHDKVPALVAAIDVALIPRAAQYASPLKLFEYMAAGKAIVAPRQPNIEEIVTDGVDSLLFSPENEGELSTALARVIGNPGCARSLARRRSTPWIATSSRGTATRRASCAPSRICGRRLPSHTRRERFRA
jgi:glycosyltransferase involved in cell wall biosynthesis